MTYVEGFIVPIPRENRDVYRKHASDAAPLFQEFGVTRMVEAWESDVPEGKVTDFRKAVQAKEDEQVVFSWFEYPSKAVRDAANEKMRTDPRMKEMGEQMPFDGKRMIFGGFEGFVEHGSGTGGFVDGFVTPVPEGNREAYRAMADKVAGKFTELGAVRVVEAWESDVPDGQVTDFRRAVKVEDGEKVVFSWTEWPDKATRDAAWKKMMEDPDMQPGSDMPFDGKRMFWGGFEKLVDSGQEAGARTSERELA